MKKAQGERVKEIRKDHNLTLKAFGERIGMKNNSLSQIENGVNALTDMTTKLICKEFSVNENWLLHGTGEKYKDVTKISLDDYARSKGADELDLKIIKLYLELEPDIRHAVVDHFYKGLSKINFDECLATSKTSEGSPKVLDDNTTAEELPAASLQDKLVIQDLMKVEPKEENSAG